MVLRARDSVGQIIKTELAQTREEFLEMLPAEMGEYELLRRVRAFAVDQCQNQAGHQRIVKFGDSFVAGNVIHDECFQSIA